MRTFLRTFSRRRRAPSCDSPQAPIARLNEQLKKLNRQVGRQDSAFERQARLRLERMSEQLDDLLRLAMPDVPLTEAQTRTLRRALAILATADPRPRQTPAGIHLILNQPADCAPGFV